MQLCNINNIFIFKIMMENVIKINGHNIDCYYSQQIKDMDISLEIAVVITYSWKA